MNVRLNYILNYFLVCTFSAFGNDASISSSNTGSSPKIVKIEKQVDLQNEFVKSKIKFEDKSLDCKVIDETSLDESALNERDLVISQLWEEFPELSHAWQKWQSMHVVIKDWSKSKQQQLGIRVSDTILYPFGGGDVVFPISFFPDFKELVIVGLEPVGKAVSFKARSGIAANLAYLFSHGNFVTRDMEKFAKSGVSTVIYIQIKRLGAKKIRCIISNSMVEFDFILNGISRKIVYIKMNLDDKHFVTWACLFEKYKDYTLFMKSASFVPQQPGFNKIKMSLMSGAHVILQDDTGISYNDLRENGYYIDLCGAYYLRYTIVGLEHFFQEDLKEAYDEVKPALLPFAIGYRSESVPSNIMWAYKFDSPKIEAN